MNIIRKGQIPGEKVIQKTCGTCNTVFEFKRKEIQSSHQYNETYLYVNCPLCNATIEVDPDNGGSHSYLDR